MKAIGKNSLSSCLGYLFNILSATIALVLVLAVGFVIAGQNVTAWFDSNGLPSVDALSPHVKMAVPVAGTLGTQTESLGVRGTLRFQPRQDSLLIVNSVIAIAALLATLWVLNQFRALFRTLSDNQPFAPSNAMRVRRIGWSVIVGELARGAIVYFESRYAMQHFSIPGMQLESRFDVNTVALVSGLMVLVLAEVLREGIRLHEEQSLTV